MATGCHHSYDFPIRQKVDDGMWFKIADKSAVALPLAPCPVVYADNPRL